MRNGNKCQAKRAKIDLLIRLYDINRNLVNAMVIQFDAQYRARESCCVDRALQALPEIRHRADMIFVRMRDNKAGYFLTVLLQEFRVRQDEVDARKPLIRKSHAAIDDKEFPAGDIDVHVHAELLATAERDEIERVFFKVRFMKKFFLRLIFQLLFPFLMMLIDAKKSLEGQFIIYSLNCFSMRIEQRREAAGSDHKRLRAHFF